MFCNNCGSQVNHDEKYCVACGEENPQYVAPKGRRRASGNVATAPATAEAEKKAKTKATVALIFGIVSIVLGGGWLGLVLSIIALALLKSTKKVGDFKVAKAGKILAVIGLIMSIISLLLIPLLVIVLVVGLIVLRLFFKI